MSSIKMNRLTLFREIIAVYCENHAKHISTLCRQNEDDLHAKKGVIKFNILF
jgi:hypothetical protein